ncbi:MAG: tetratricopeptide repeat protein [Balneolaceae bacterium]
MGRSNPPLARAYASEAIEISQELGLTRLEARAQGNMGISYAVQGKLDSALIYMENALSLFTEISDLHSMARTNSSIGTIYAIQTQHAKAITYLLDTLPIFEELGDSVSLALTYFNIGQMYIDQGLFSEALERTLKSEEIYEAIGRRDKIPVTSAAIAQSLMEFDRDEEALVYIERGLEELENYVDLVSAMHLNNMAGRIYDRSEDDLIAKEFYTKALGYAKQLKSTRLAINIRYNLAGIEYQFENYSRTKVYLADLISTIEEENLAGFDRLKSNALGMLSKTEAKLGNNNAAFEYMEMAKALSDSLYEEENAKAIAELETIYETEKKENQIQLLEIESEAASLKFTIAVILGVSIIVVIIFVFWQYQRRKTEERRIELESVKRELEQYGVLLVEKNNFMSSVKENLEGIKGSVKSYEAKKELNVLVDSLHHNVNLVEAEEEMFQKIEQVNSGFFMELRQSCTDITKNDERLASLVQMDLRNKDIANILNINPRSVNQAKYRLKKKLNLPNETDLRKYLKSVGT